MDYALTPLGRSLADSLALPESQFRYYANYRAMRVNASQAEVSFRFYDRTGTLIDSVQMKKP